ncbi:MAG: hypothetical protein LAO24_15245 [Acidobacteriia bacterium]|nr:hypothetical protein [Terriglobia bacterium]
MTQNFTLYEIYQLAGGADDEQFDTTRLPFEIIQGVRIEEVSSFLKADTFTFVEPRMGSDAARDLQQVQIALVHRYQSESGIYMNQEEEQIRTSAQLVYNLAACLRLIRPMRQSALLMQGTVRDDGTFDVLKFDHPLEFHEVPEVQKHFTLRNRDADELKRRAPEFLRAMNGPYWKFRMAAQFHELGHFQPWQAKARYILWSCAIESIYTSHHQEHMGSLVARERIKWFLGASTSIYAPGDISTLLPQPAISVGEIVNDLYKVRNFIAHGDRIPDSFFSDARRHGFNGRVPTFEVLLEAASFIVRSSLLKILRDQLLDNFADAAPAEAYFGKAGLTRSELRRRFATKP